MSTFEHTMMVIDRMHDICEERDIGGDARIRRLLMAVAHDIGKVTIANEKGGLNSDEPPERFAGHANIGKAQIPHIAEKLGLEKQYEKAMQDACEHHMDFFDVYKVLDNVDDHQSAYSVEWIYSFLSNFEHENHPNDSTIYGATPDEMLDLTHADHEGRLELDTEVERVGGTWTWPEPEDGDLDTVRPTLDREPYERVLDAVYGQLGQVDGYLVMREGLCETHTRADPAPEERQGVLSRCDDCRTPGSWIGERIDELTLELIREELRDDD